MSPIQQLFLGTGSVATKTYVDDVFSTFLYTGTSSARSINNGIDLSGKGGLVWSFGRDTGWGPYMVDTERGASKNIHSSNQDAEDTNTTAVTAFNNNGYSLGADGSGGLVNYNTKKYVSWTFRKAPGFFDVVTWTGNGTSGRQISHQLGSVPGAIFVKRTDGTTNWAGYHRGVNSGTNPEQYDIRLNLNNAGYSTSTKWNNTAPTATHFTVGNAGSTNGNGNTYVAYIFAHDDQSFGEGGNQSIIKCGYFTGTGGGYEVFADLGWEPQWILYKSSSASGTTAGNWFIFDALRGLHYKANDESPFLAPNTNDSEGNLNGYDWSSIGLDVTSTGFTPSSGTERLNKSSEKYIYVAIRRPDGYVGKPYGAGEGTSVFAMDTGNSSSTQSFTSGFPVDFALVKLTSSSGTWDATGRLIQGKYLTTNTSNLEATWADYKFDQQDGFGTDSGFTSSTQSWMWKRHAGFDVVSYEGNNSSTRNINHSMNKIPEMIWVKLRTSTSGFNWAVYHKDVVVSPNFYELVLNSSDAQTNSENYNGAFGGVPTSTYFTVKSGTMANGSSKTYIAMLFASVEGISKVGSYDGSSSAQTITTGFAPRFLILKNITDNGSGWIVLDTTRGWGSGGDQMLNINNNEAQNNLDNLGAPTSTGFTVSNVNSQWNAANKKYIYYCHA